MREYIIADNQDISKAGMMFLLSKQKDVATLLEADNKAELIQQLRLYPQAPSAISFRIFFSVCVSKWSSVIVPATGEAAPESSRLLT